MFSFTKLFASWIDHGRKPASAKEQSALLDESRSALKSIIDRVESGEIKMACQTDIAAKQYAAIRPAITAKKPIYNRTPQAAPAKPSTPAAKPTASSAQTKPAPAAATATPTAHAVQQAELLAKAILDETAKREAAAKLRTRAQFRQMTPREANEFFRNGGKLVD